MNQSLNLYLNATLETVLMTLISTLIAFVIGLPLGIILYSTSDKGLKPNKVINRLLGGLVNIIRSIPFILLMLYVMPISRALVGTTIGLKAIIPALSISAIPFVARLVESNLSEVDYGLIEAIQSMGASRWQIIKNVLLVESKVSLVKSATITVITILGYGAMSGFLGAGGLGTLAINFGYYREHFDVMTICIVLLIILVQIIQSVGNFIATKIDRK